MDTILKEQKIKLRKVSLDGLEDQKSKLRKVSLDGLEEQKSKLRKVSLEEQKNKLRKVSLEEQKSKLRKVSLEDQKSELRKVSLDDSGLDFSGFGHVEPVFFASGFRRRHSHVPLTESKRRATPKKVKYADFVWFFWTSCDSCYRKISNHIEYKILYV